jgi:hypothetical protein
MWIAGLFCLSPLEDLSIFKLLYYCLHAPYWGQPSEIDNRVDEEIAKATAEAVWNTSKNIRDSIKIARMAKAVGDVNWLVSTFLDPLGK